MKLTRFALIVSVCWMLFPMTADVAYADAVNPLDQLQTVGKQAYGDEGDRPAELPVIIGRVINQALGLLGIITVVLIIYGGFLWMTAMGNNEQIEKAKKLITNAVIGLVIILAAYSITYFVVGSIINGTTGG